MKALVCFLGFLALTGLAYGQLEMWGRTDTQKEIEIGRGAYEEIVRSGLRSKNEAFCRRVDRILAQLVAAMPAKNYPFQAVVIGESEVNANCLPGGYVTVYDGLIAWMPDDNELAFILAHEIGHGYRRHWSRLMRKMQTDTAFRVLIATVTGGRVSQRGLQLDYLAHSREHESEADEFGTELYLRAGFDPAKVTDGFQSLREFQNRSGGRAPPEYLSTHPNIDRRIADVGKTAERLVKAGLKPVAVNAPDLTVESVFGKIPTIASRPCKWQPTEPGTRWQYEVRGAGSTSRYSVEAVGLAQVDGTAVSRMKMTVGGKDVFYQLIADDDRVWRRNRPEDAKSTWSVESLFPEEDGVLEGGKWAFKNLGTEKIETPAGVYEGCLKLAATDGTGRVLTLWFAPDVGLVRRWNEKSGVDEVLVGFRKP